MINLFNSYRRSVRCLILTISIWSAYLYSAAAFAQEYNEYIPSVSAFSGESVSIAAANNYYSSAPGVEHSDAGDYRPRDDSRLISLARKLGYPEGGWSNSDDADNAKLAYVTKVYLYVKNGIDFTPLFGLQHGAMGAMYHRSGTAFDQAHLLVELLAVADISATYDIGSIELNAEDLKSWVGVQSLSEVCELFSGGGIPTSFGDCEVYTVETNNSAMFEVGHVWINVETDSNTYTLDPALKIYTVFSPKVNLDDLLTTSSSEILSAIGGLEQNGNTEYVNPNPILLREYLEGISEGFVSNLSNNTERLSMRDIIGGRQITVFDKISDISSQDRYQSWSGNSDLMEVPLQFMAHAIINVNREGHDAVQEQAYEVALPLYRIGVDTISMSPVFFTKGGGYEDGMGVYEVESARFELMIMRPGEESTLVQSDTGAGAPIGALENELSGENLLEITMTVQDAVNSQLYFSIAYDAPYVGDGGEFGDKKVYKVADTLTASVLIISAGEIIQQPFSLVDAFIPNKTNLWYGLYQDTLSRRAACQGDEGFEAVQGAVAAAEAAYNTSYSVHYNCDDSCTAAEHDEAHFFASSMANMASSTAWNDSFLLSTLQFDNNCIASFGDDEIAYVHHNKDLKLKTLMSMDFSQTASSLIRRYGRLANGTAQHSVSLGIVSAETTSLTSLQFKQSGLFLDVDTDFIFARRSEGSNSLKSVAVAISAGLSSLEGLILQKYTSAPRVDSAVTKVDWYTWNADYDPVTALHHGPYEAGAYRTTKNGIARFVLSGSIADGAVLVKPARFDLGPVEASEQLAPPSEFSLSDDAYAYNGREGRSSTASILRDFDNSVSVSHVIGFRKKGGAGVDLPEFADPSFDDLQSQDSNISLLPAGIAVDGITGALKYSPDTDISIGSGAQGSLTFTRGYDSENLGNGPLGQGWSHNHEAKLSVSTNLVAAYVGQNPIENIPTIVAALTSLHLGENINHPDGWFSLPQSLMIHAWAMDRTTDNEITVSTVSGGGVFFQYNNGKYMSANNSQSTLVQNGYKRFYESKRRYVSNNTRRKLIALQGSPERHFNESFPKRNWNVYEQYFDYSDVSFDFMSNEKTIAHFTRGKPFLTSAVSFSCLESTLTPYINHEHNVDKCGKAAGNWKLIKLEDTTGREIEYHYEEVSAPIFASGIVLTGELLTKVRDNRSGFELNFEYFPHFGVLTELASPLAEIIEGDSLDLNELAGVHIPSSWHIQGQTYRLSSVEANVPDSTPVSFQYGQSPGFSPLLQGVTDLLESTHKYEYSPALGAPENDFSRRRQLEKVFAPSLVTELAQIEYDYLGDVVSIADASSYKTVFQFNGVVNTQISPIGTETMTLYDPQGRLIETISPEYTIPGPY